MGVAIGRQCRIFRTEHHGQSEGLGIGHTPAQNAGIAHAPGTIADRHATGCFQAGHITEHIAIKATGDGTDRQHPNHTSGGHAVENQIGHGTGIIDRRGFRRGTDRGETTMGGGSCFRGNIALLAIARLPEITAQVDKTGRDHLPGGVQCCGALGCLGLLSNRLYATITHQQPRVTDQPLARLKQLPAGQFQAALIPVR